MGDLNSGNLSGQGPLSLDLRCIVAIPIKLTKPPVLTASNVDSCHSAIPHRVQID